MVDLVEIMARLRSPDGCPWDREQDHRSLRRCLLEEAYEVLEAIDRGDAAALRDELGDLLLQVIFHAQLADEAGEFDAWDVVQALYDKLVSRHPHVFGEAEAETSEDVLHQWDGLKRRERGESEDNADPFEGVPRALPALSRAQVIARRTARAAPGPTAEEAAASARAALAALGAPGLDPDQAEMVLGDLLLAVVELARLAGLDAEQALRERVDHRLEELR